MLTEIVEHGDVEGDLDERLANISERSKKKIHSIEIGNA